MINRKEKMLSNFISFFVGMYVAQEYAEVPNLKLVVTKCMKEFKKHLENENENDPNKKK